MIWHIFLKDCRRLLLFAVIVALVHGVNAVVSIVLGPFMQPSELRVLGQIFPVLSMLSLAALVAMTVQQDPIPGTDQDWLVRPIRPRDLFAAKLLFVVVVAHGPLFMADLLECSVLGFDGPASLGAALADNASKFFLISLPAMCVAAVTRDITEMIVGGVAVVLSCAVALILVGATGHGDSLLAGSGLAWLRPALLATAFLVLAAIILPLQYLRRRTMVSRKLIVVGAASVVLAWSFVPWDPSYALQRRIGARGSGTDQIDFHFDPQSRSSRERADTSVGGGVNPADVVRLFRASLDRSSTVRVAIPIRISGIGNGTRLILDLAHFRFVGKSGATVYESTSRWFSDSSARIEPDASPGHADIEAHQVLFVPSSVYSRAQHEPLRLEIDYSLTVLTADPTLKLSMSGGRARDAAAHSCIAQYDPTDGDVDVGCLTPQKFPTCVDVSLVNESTKASNPPFEGCGPDYSPFQIGLEQTHLVRRFGVELPSYDHLTRSALPVSGRMLTAATVVIAPYEARAHLSRHLVIPGFVLGDW